MRLVAAPLRGVVLSWFKALFMKQNRGYKHLLLLFLVVQPTGFLWKDFSKNSNAYNPS